MSHPHQDTTTCDVLVVGAGPAGLAAAITLARLGIDVLVVERHAGTSPFPKATGVSTRTMELFRSWGIEQQIRSGAMRVQPVMTVSDTLFGEVKVTVPFGYPSDAAALAVSPCTPCCCAQDHLEPVMVDHLLDKGGRVRFGVELTGLVERPTGVRADLLERASGRVEHVRANYLIGADGPRSAVRAAVGIGIDDMGTIGEFIGVTFRAGLTRRFEGLPAAINSVELPGAEGIFVPTGADDRWIYAREWHPGRSGEIVDWTTGHCTELIRTATGVPDLHVEILTVMPFVMGGHVAQAFRSGRTFLVGDAAHRTTPVGATGMNTAIHAAHNLGWKLAWVLRGWAGDTLLDSYEDERRPIGTRNVLRSLQRGPAPAASGAGTGVGSGEDGDGLARDIGVRYSSAVIDSSPTPAAQPEGIDTTCAATAVTSGCRFAHAWVRRNGVRISTLDLFDGRFTVLAASTSGRRVVDELAATGLPITALVIGEDLHDDDGELARRYRFGADGAVLVRPDGFVAWRGCLGATAVSAELATAVEMALGWQVPSVLGRTG